LLLKDSSLVSVIALEELLRAGQLIVTRTFKPVEIYALIAIIYLIMTSAISVLVTFTERWLRVETRGDQRRTRGARGVARAGAP